MIHYKEIADIEERLRDIEDELDCGYSAEVETRLYQEQNELNNTLERLRTEQEEYREGYQAGMEYHMDGTGMRDEWLGRFGAFRQGFDQAGQDS